MTNHFELVAVLLVLLLCVGAKQQVVADKVLIDSGSDGGTFEYDKAIAKNIRRVIDMAWTPDGRVLIAGKEGEIYIFDDGDVEGDKKLIHNVNPCTEQERSLLSILVHPKFGTKSNGQFDFVYAYWVHKGKDGNCMIPDNFKIINKDGPYCQLSRFQLTKSNKLQDEEVLLRTGNAGKMHNGGGMSFGPDGNLYLATGDTGYPRSIDPANNLDNLWGKILRIKDDGTVPSDNPYVGQNKSQRCGGKIINPGDGKSRVCTEIFARGFRNPFSLEMNPNIKNGDVEFHISDVGRENWEEINIGGTGYEKANYGWREREGPCQMGKTSSNSCDKVDPLEFVDPIHFYQHTNSRGSACVGGSFIPNGIWPKEYDNEYLYADLRAQSIFHMKLDKDNECRGKQCDKQKSKYIGVPIVNNIEGNSVLRLRFGPHSKKRSDQISLYHLLYDSGKINRLTYVGKGGDSDDNDVTNNRKPEAVIETFYSSDEKGVTVRFDGSKSIDPDGDKLSMEWEFGEEDQDDTNDDSPITSHTYRKSGRFTASLKVSDGNGKTSKTTVTINVDKDYDRSSDSDHGIPTLQTFPWSEECDSYHDDDTNIDRCGILEFCFDEDSGIYGYQIAEGGQCGILTMGSAPVIRLQPGFTYRLTLRNLTPDPTNIHTHGLHIVGSGNGDDVTRVIDGGGNCMDYTWDIRSDHPGGTYWYHPHAHSFSEVQVNGGASGLLVVEDNTNNDDDIPGWASNELLLQILRLDDGYKMLSNGRSYEIFNLKAGKWYRMRISTVDPLGAPQELRFTSGCEVHKVASDGVWHSVVPFDEGSMNKFEMTGSSRGDFAIRCNISPGINIRFSDTIVAILNIKQDGSSTLRQEIGRWQPKRPPSIQNMVSATVADENKLVIKIKRDSINDREWNPFVPLGSLAYDEVHEWELPDTREHPFHIHLYHMQVATPNGCGNDFREGEFYDTISAGPCTVRFRTSDFGQRLVVHCHVMLHSDLGSMGWFDVRGAGMPVYELTSQHHDCSGNIVPSPTISPTRKFDEGIENCKIFDKLSFTANANKFCEYSDTTIGNDAEEKQCGMGPVDMKLSINSSSCNNDCFVAFTIAGEFVTYKFLTSSTVGNVMIKAKVASKLSKKKRFRLIMLDQNSESGVLLAPGKGYEVFEEVTWELSGLPKGLHHLQVYFIDGNINLCSIEVQMNLVSEPGPTLAPMQPSVSPLNQSTQPNNDWPIDDQSNDVSEPGPTLAPMQPSVSPLPHSPNQSTQRNNDWAIDDQSNDEEPRMPISIPPVTWAALDYYEAFEKTPESIGDGCNFRGDGVDAKRTEDRTCIVRDNSQCYIGWWDPGEHLLYRISIPRGLSQNYDIKVRVASKREARDVGMEIISFDGTKILQSKQFEAPGNGWQNFKDVVWDSIDLNAGRYILKILSNTGSINLCSTSVMPTNNEPDQDLDFEIQVPGYYNALHYANIGLLDTTVEHRGDCPYRKNTPVDAKMNDDLVCKQAISEYDLHCHIAFTEVDEFLTYRFRKVPTQTKVRVSLRVASKSPREILVELDSLETADNFFFRATKVVQTSGNEKNSWDIYETIAVWDEIDIGIAENYSLKIVFLSGRTNLCAIGIDYISLVV